MLDRFFTVLTITSLFLVNGPVGQTWSNLVNLGQTWSNLVKALQTLGNVSWTIFRGFLGKVGPSRVENGSVKPRSNLVKPQEMCPGPSSWEYLMWRGFVRSCWLGSGCLVLRVDTRENPVGKNGVMINMVRCDLVQKFKPKTCFLEKRIREGF